MTRHIAMSRAGECVKPAGAKKIAAVESRMAGPFQFPSSSKPPKPPLKPNGTVATTKCDDIDSLDAELSALVGKTLALSDGLPPDANGNLIWMTAKVIPLTRTGLKPYVSLSPAEFKLLGHSRGTRRIDMTVEGGCGTRGELRLHYPRSGWRLYIVRPAAVKPPPAQQQPELADEPAGCGRRRDNIFRKMFS